MGFPGSSMGKGSACSAGDPGLILGLVRALENTPVFLPGKPLLQRQRSLVGSMGSQELDMTE